MYIYEFGVKIDKRDTRWLSSHTPSLSLSSDTPSPSLSVQARGGWQCTQPEALGDSQSLVGSHCLIDPACTNDSSSICCTREERKRGRPWLQRRARACWQLQGCQLETAASPPPSAAADNAAGALESYWLVPPSMYAHCMHIVCVHAHMSARAQCRHAAGS